MECDEPPKKEKNIGVFFFFLIFPFVTSSRVLSNSKVHSVDGGIFFLLMVTWRRRRREICRESVGMCVHESLKYSEE